MNTLRKEENYVMSPEEKIARVEFKTKLTELKVKIIERTENQIKHRKDNVHKSTYNAIEISAYLNVYWLFKARDKNKLPHAYENDTIHCYMINKMERIIKEFELNIEL